MCMMINSFSSHFTVPRLVPAIHFPQLLFRSILPVLHPTLLFINNYSYLGLYLVSHNCHIVKKKTRHPPHQRIIDQSNPCNQKWKIFTNQQTELFLRQIRRQTNMLDLNGRHGCSNLKHVRYVKMKIKGFTVQPCCWCRLCGPDLSAGRQTVPRQPF